MVEGLAGSSRMALIGYKKSGCNCRFSLPHDVPPSVLLKIE